MNVCKDNGHGVTRQSLEFWRANRAKIGPVLSLECGEACLRGMLSPSGVPLEYTCIIYGRDGEIWLSGCTCGYGGEGPRGTAHVLMDIGVPENRAFALRLQDHIDYHVGGLPNGLIGKENS
jgi:hypothetical protein